MRMIVLILLASLARTLIASYLLLIIATMSSIALFFMATSRLIGFSPDKAGTSIINTF